jgi:hypothetical protein
VRAAGAAVENPAGEYAYAAPQPLQPSHVTVL